MTRRDFELIAGVVRFVAELKTTDKGTLYLLAYAFATELAKNNSRFERQRFMDACGVEA